MNGKFEKLRNEGMEEWEGNRGALGKSKIS
jgi:hypothetical protein